MGIIKKCVISRYDEKITEPPFLTIPIDKIEVEQPEIDHLGEKFSLILFKTCQTKGYEFQFYSTSKDKYFDYEVVVY